MRTLPMIVAALLLVLALPAASWAETAAAEPRPAAADTLKGAAAADQEGKDRLVLSLGYNFLDLSGVGYYLVPFANEESHPTVGIGMLRSFANDTWLMADAAYEGEGEDMPLYGLDVHLSSPGGYEARLQANRRINNRRNVSLPPAATGSTMGFTATDLDPAAEYEIFTSEMDLSGRVKMPDYPAHLRLAVRQYENQGTIQQMRLNESCSGSTGSCHLVSAPREIKTVTRELETGLDAHLGLVDVSLTVLSSEFADESPASSYSYTTVAGARTGPPAIPDTSYSSRTLAVSTNSAGKVALGLGLGSGERENKSAGLTEKASHAGLEFLWRPLSSLSLALKGRRTEQKQEPGASVEASRLAGGLPVEPETTHDIMLATATYAPAVNLHLRGDASRDTTRRDGTAGWSIPADTTTDTWKFALEGKPGSGLDLKFSFQGRSTNNPSYPNVPTEERKNSLTASWAPLPQAQLVSSVIRTVGENSLSGNYGDRTLFHNSATYSPSPPVTMNLIYDHFIDDLAADIYFSEGLVVDVASPYRSRGDLFLFSVSWQTSPTLVVTGEASYALVKAGMSVAVPSYEGIEDYSRVDAAQQGVALGVRADLGGGWGLTSRLALAQFEERAGTAEDEKITQATALVSKSW
jgi:hypothetical protein